MLKTEDLRIACLLPAATDICIALGLENQIVGVTHECDSPPPPPTHDKVVDTAVMILTRDGLTGEVSSVDDLNCQGLIHLAVQQQSRSTKYQLYPIVPQAWAKAQPNLVITQDLCAVCGPTSADVYTASNGSTIVPKIVSLSPHTLSDIVDCIESVGTACGVDQDHTTQVMREFTLRIERIQQGVISAVDFKRPTALVLEWLDPPFDGGHWIPEMLETAGFSPALPKPPGTKSSVLTWEQIDSAAPDVVIVSCCGFGLKRNLHDARQHRSLFTNATQKVYAVDGNRYFARPGPQLSFGVVILAQLVADATNNFDWLNGITPNDLERVKRGVAWDIIIDQSKHELFSSCDMEDLGDTLSSFDDLHRTACARGEFSYNDPSTGYDVFTELAHKKRGKCCGSGCRHCPFHHENVKDKVSYIQQPAVLHKGSICANGLLKVLFFSGGKDSFLTLRALLRQSPRPCVVLLTTFDATTRVVAHQEVHIRDIQRQAQHLDLTLIGVPLHRASGADYVDRVQESLSFVESTLGMQVEALVFGDLHLEHIRSWREDRLSPLGYQIEYPLWQINYEVLMKDLLASQVVCVVSASSTEHVPVGTVFDLALYEFLEGNNEIDTFGERGEFHSIAQVWTADRWIALGVSDQK